GDGRAAEFHDEPAHDEKQNPGEQRIRRPAKGQRSLKKARIHTDEVGRPQPGPKPNYCRPGRAFPCAAWQQQAVDMARYIDEILQPDEKILYSTTVHWIFYTPGIVAWIIAFVGWVMERRAESQAA